MQNSHYDTLYNYELDHWWYKTRRALVHEIIQKYRPKNSLLSIADIGCGTGALTKELELYGSCTGIDLSAQAVQFCHSRHVKDVRVGSAENTGCPEDMFDIVVCLDVLEHLNNDMDGINEIHRVLKPGGVAIIFIPAFMFLWSVTDEISHHHRRYRLHEIISKFLSGNFTILRGTYFNTFLFVLIAPIRVLVRTLHIPMKSETETGHGIINTILYAIFSLEIKFLKFTNLPFGVSIMVVVKKD